VKDKNDDEEKVVKVAAGFNRARPKLENQNKPRAMQAPVESSREKSSDTLIQRNDGNDRLR
jgi:hypothetical protein